MNQIRRRELLIAAAGLFVLPAAQAQQTKTIGMLLLPSREAAASNVQAFQRGLAELGYVEGRNIQVEYRYADGKIDRLPALAAELVAANVNVIVTATSPATKAAGQATRTIPIVFATAGDPVAAGHVSNLARPGGNITGFSVLARELSTKRLELLKEMAPSAGRVALLFNPDDSGMTLRVTEASTAAQGLGIAVQPVQVREPSDFDGAFSAIEKGRPDVLLTVLDGFTFQHRDRIVDFASRKRLPAMYESSAFVNSGGLVSYGPSLPDNYRRAAGYVHKILNGSKPGDLPVELPTRFELFVNLKTARALGVTIPPSILLRADRVIE